MSSDALTTFDVYSHDESQWVHIGSEVPIPKEDWVEGDWDAGYIHWLRDDDSREVDRPMQSGVYHTASDVKLNIEITGDEFIYVLEGSFTIELDSGETHTFGTHEAVHLRPGLKGVWTYHAPFRQFITIVYAGGVADRTEHKQTQ